MKKTTCKPCAIPLEDAIKMPFDKATVLPARNFSSGRLMEKPGRCERPKKVHVQLRLRARAAFWSDPHE